MAAQEPMDTMTTSSTMGSTAPAATTSYGRFDRYRGPAHAILRIGAGLLFMQHGAQKLLGWFGGMDGSGATAELISQMGLAGVLELVGGLMIVVGLFTRPVALVLLLEMLAAYVLAHLPQGWIPIENQGELALLYALIWLYFAAAGAGPASVDRQMGRDAAATAEAVTARR